MTINKHAFFRLRLWAGLAALAAILVSAQLTYAQTTATMYTDGTNFGIGTTGPTQKLQVVGTISASSFSGDGSGLTGISAGGWTDGGTNVYTSTTTDNVGVGTTTPSTTLEIVQQSSRSPLMVSATAAGDGNLFIISPGGSVGIGSVSPQMKIDVVGSGNPLGDLGASYRNTDPTGYANNRFENSISSTAWVGLGGSGVAQEAWANRAYFMGYTGSYGVSIISHPGGSNSDIRFYIGGSSITEEKMRIDDAGNVGIGTFDIFAGLSVMNGNVGIGTFKPIHSLAVNGNIGIGTTRPYQTISAPRDGMAIEGNVGIGTWAANSGKLVVMGGNVGIGTVAPGGILDVGTVAGIPIASNLPTYQVGIHQQSGTASDETLILTNGGGILRPSSIQFRGSSALNSNVFSTGRIVSGAAGTGYSSSYLTLSSSSGNNSFNSEMTLTNGNVGVGTSAPVAGLAVMNGNAGIGTWSPTAKLQVVGSVSATSFYGDGSNLTGISGGSSGWTDGGTNVYTTTTTDNVAIGTTTPSSILEVSRSQAGWTNVLVRNTTTNTSSGSSFTAGNLGGNNVSFGVEADNDGGNARIWNAANTDIYFGTNNSERMRILRGGSVGIGTSDPVNGTAIMNGNVGIGTWSPANRLSIVGNIGIGTTLPYRRIAAPNNGMVVEGNVGIGTWTVNTGKFVVLGGNVGIGSSSPNDFLDVFDSMTIHASNNANMYMLGLGVTTGLSLTNWNTSGNSSIGSGSNLEFTIDTDINNSNNYFVFTGDNTTVEYMRINDNGSIGIGTSNPVGGTAIMNGNVGIGTWSPVNRLHVLGNIGIGTTLPYRRIAAPNNGMVIEGNVGIGTWNPTTKLDVYGDLIVTESTTAGGNGLEVYYKPTGTTVFDVSPGGGLLIRGNNDFPSATLLKVEHNGATGNFMEATQTVSGDRFLINSSGNVGIGTTNPRGALTVMNGNAGIGTWSPTAKLQVVGSVSATSFYGDGSNLTGISGGSSGWTDGGTNVYTSTTTDNVGIGTTTPSTTLEIVKQGTQAPLMVSATAAGDGDYLIVNSAGNVGIGTVSALNTKLTINGGISSVGSSAGSFVLSEQSSNGSNTITIIAPSSVTADRTCTLEDDDTPFDGCVTAGSAGGWTDGGTNVYTSTTTDNVAIGTTTPASLLTVRGNVGIGTTTPYRTIAAPANGMIVEGNVGIGTFAANSGKLIVMGGSVGMGTTAPGEEFVVYRSQASGTVVSVLNPSGSSGGYAEFNAGSDAGNVRFGIEENAIGGAAYVWNAANTPLEFATNNLERMRITNSGNIGIGTTLHAAALAVMNGNVGIGTWSPVNRLQVKGSFTTGTVTLADAATIATDASLGNLFRVTLGGNRTLGNPTNPVDGQRVTWELIQDGSGSRTISLDTKFALGSDISSVTLTTTATKRDFLGAIYNAAEDKWYVVSFVKGY